METIQTQSEICDPIPKHLKELFFPGVDPPDIVEDYNVLGFDADHCLVKYNIANLSALMTKALCSDLIEKHGYPAELANVPADAHSIGLNNSVWDIENNLILQLVEGRVVAQAYRGFRQLTDLEIREVYGEPPIMHWLDYPQVVRKCEEQKGAYHCFMTYFDSVKLVAVAQCIDFQQRGLLGSRSNLDLANDLNSCILSQYAHYTADEVHRIGNYGIYFPTVLAEPTRYIEPQPDLRMILERLRSLGVKLFVASNSHKEYMDLIMETTFGKGWELLFDLKCAACAKPKFFQDRTRYFHTIDFDMPNFKFEEIRDPKLLTDKCDYLEGNAFQVHEYFQHLLGKKQIKVAYFGDHYWSDAYHSASFQWRSLDSDIPQKWDSIAVIEELFYEHDKLTRSQLYPAGASPNLIDTRPFWGPSYFIKGGKRNFFVSEVAGVARYAIPFVRNLNLLMRL